MRGHMSGKEGKVSCRTMGERQEYEGAYERKEGCAILSKNG